MRKVSEAEYTTAKAVLVHRGALDCPTINMHLTSVELFELERDMPEKFYAYVCWSDNANSRITTWTGEIIGRVTHEGRWHRNNFGGKWRQLTIRTDWNQSYAGREYDSRQLASFRRLKA